MTTDRRRALLVAAFGLIQVLLLASCGILLGQKTETPEDVIIVRPGVTHAYQLQIRYRVEGAGGRVHAPFDMSQYSYIDRDYLLVNTLEGRVDGSDLKFSDSPDRAQPLTRAARGTSCSDRTTRSLFIWRSRSTSDGWTIP